MSSQDKVKKGQRKSALCGHFMAEWDEHHYCPKCRDDFKGDDPCANFSDCLISASFSEDQRKKIRNRNRYKSKKDQNSSGLVDSNKDACIDDSLLDEDESAVSVSSQVLSSQKNKSLEDKLDRFFTEFAPFSQRLQNLEQKGAETVVVVVVVAVSRRLICLSSNQFSPSISVLCYLYCFFAKSVAETVSSLNSGRDSLHVAKQSVESTKAPASGVSSVIPGRLDRRSATITRTEFEQQASASHIQDETGLGSRKRTFSQFSEDADPDLEQGEICPREEDSPAYSDTLETIKNG